MQKFEEFDLQDLQKQLEQPFEQQSLPSAGIDLNNELFNPSMDLFNQFQLDLNMMESTMDNFLTSIASDNVSSDDSSSPASSRYDMSPNSRHIPMLSINECTETPRPEPIWADADAIAASIAAGFQVPKLEADTVLNVKPEDLRSNAPSGPSSAGPELQTDNQFMHMLESNISSMMSETPIMTPPYSPHPGPVFPTSLQIQVPTDGIASGPFSAPPRSSFMPIPMARRPTLVPLPSASATTPTQSIPILPQFMTAETFSKMASILPFNTMPQKLSRRVLNEQELRALFTTANSHANLTRCKRDIAILCLILDTHLSSGNIIKLTFECIPTIIASVDQPDESVRYENHHIDVLQPTTTSNPSRHTLHPFTAWALRVWTTELIKGFGWGTASTNPLFVNSQPLFDNNTGERTLRQTPLKRDAISKVFQSIKQRSGVQCPKNMTASSNLMPIEPCMEELKQQLIASQIERLGH
jgi:hypothetical protein